MNNPNSQGFWRRNEIAALRTILLGAVPYEIADPESWEELKADRRRLAELEEQERTIRARAARMKTRRP